jgi:biopolymer transport protein ExbD
MNKFLLILSGLLPFIVVNAQAQVPKNRSVQKTTKHIVTKETETTLPAEYKIYATVLKGQGLFLVGVEPSLASNATLNEAFQAFFKDHFGVKRSTAPGTRRESPKVVIRFMDDDDIATLLNAVALVRVSEKTVVELEYMLGDIHLFTQPPLAEAEQINIKPNPLTLIVTMDDQQNISLNNDEMGKLSDLSVLSEFLQKIYRAREENGVFRENTNEIEKTVSIKMPLKSSAADLIKIAKALKTVGADRIVLQTDDLIEPRRDLIREVQELPSPKKKPTR